MPSYKAPLKEIQFIYHDLLDSQSHFAALTLDDDFSIDLIDSILETVSKFSEKTLAPMNRYADEEGCHWSDGNVTTPKGFADAYRSFADDGWQGLIRPKLYNGQGLPPSVELLTKEIVGEANWAWSMYPGLAHGAMDTLESYGNEWQREIFLKNLVSGKWAATMCLTEPHCGTDLGLLRTKAIPNDDGSFLISGNKIFITGGDHDLTENIVHIVLARLPDAPEGTKGISLFIVPKYSIDKDGKITERNSVSCLSIEHKMGIKASATCAMSFDGAKGYLLGPPNKGLNCMFVFMNTARLGAGLQGVIHAEVGLQGSLSYTRDRLQMRSAKGKKYPHLIADPIIVHPDVRRMILTQKAIAEGGRALVMYAGQYLDIIAHSKETAKVVNAQKHLSFLTPIIKAFLTELGFESANLALQCFGGHGYIREWGMEQNVRDCRISMLYEGTTGVQALDLLSRKVVMDDCVELKCFCDEIELFCSLNSDNHQLSNCINVLRDLPHEWFALAKDVQERASKDSNEIGAASVDFLMYSGYVLLAYMWAKIGCLAIKSVANKNEDAGFYRPKIITAIFYFEKVLPRILTLRSTIKAGSQNLMELEDLELAP